MNLYVGNIDFNVSEEQLREVFSNVGQVDSARLIIDKATGRSKGFGFVEMPNAEEAQKAMDSLNGFEFNGRAITVKEAVEKSEGDRKSFKPRSGGFNKGGYNKGGGGGYNKGGGGGYKKYND